MYLASFADHILAYSDGKLNFFWTQTECMPIESMLSKLTTLLSSMSSVLGAKRQNKS